MNFIDKILNQIGLSRKGLQQVRLSEAYGGSDLFGTWRTGKKMKADQAMRVNTGWVYACVRAIAEAVAHIPFKLYEIDSEGNREEIFDHELLDMLNAANPYMTGFELKYMTAAHMQLAGNSYWLLDGVKNDSSQPIAIYPLNPKFIKVLSAPAPEFVTGYEYKVGNTTKIYKPYEVLHLRIPDPNDPYEGIGTVQAIDQWIEADNYATEVNKKFFENGARLSGLITSENEITTEQVEYLRKSFESIYKGVENAYKVGALPYGLKYEELGQTPKDMDFANLATEMRDRILAGFRVPKTILGVAESETNRATAETANYVFAARTVKPAMQLIVEYLNEFLVPRYGENLELSFEDPVPENRTERIQEMQAALGQQAAISVNEAREAYFGLAPITDGDAVRGNFSLQPIGIPEKSMNRPTSKSKVFKPRYIKSAKKRKEIVADLASKATEILKNIEIKTEEVKKKDITQLSHEEYGLIYKAFNARATRYENAEREAIKKINDGQKKEVIGNLPNLIKSKINKADTLELFNKDAWVMATVNASLPIMSDLYKTESAEAYKLIGLTPAETLTPEVLKALKHSMELMSESYHSTTIDLLTEKIKQALSSGLSIDQLKDLVSQVYEFSDEVRAQAVARTETFRIGNDATRQSWKDSGVVRSVKWYTAEDEEVCEYCGPMDGTVVAVEENFFDKGDSVGGSDGGNLDLSYSNVENPPLHVNCRCYIRPEEISLEGKMQEEPEPPKVEEDPDLSEDQVKEIETIINEE